MLETVLAGNDSAGTGTVLGEWTAIAHMNYGHGPVATVDEFVGLCQAASRDDAGAAWWGGGKARACFSIGL